MSYPNTAHSDKWKLNISNVPSINGITIDIRLFNLYAKSVILPTLSFQTLNTNFKASTIRHPISRENNDLPQLILEFKVDEDFKNYFYIFNFLQSLRYEQPETAVFRHNTIKSIDIIFLDNQKRTTNTLSFTNAFITQITSLNLPMGQSEELSFNISLIYEQILCNRQENQTSIL